MTRYMIYCCAGAGGLFLTTVFAQLLGYNAQSRFNQFGNAHDMGHGNWRGTKDICFIGNHWELNYRLNYNLYYSHILPNGFLENNPDIRLIKIHTDPIDYRKVTELFVYKAWPDMWTPEEYAKWVSPEYPPYSQSNISNSELIRNDLINDLEITNIKKWHEENLSIPTYATVNFRTIMGLDNRDLVNDICDIVKGKPSDNIRNYVAEYQQLNQNLYFNNKKVD